MGAPFSTLLFLTIQNQPERARLGEELPFAAVHAELVPSICDAVPCIGRAASMSSQDALQDDADNADQGGLAIDCAREILRTGVESEGWIEVVTKLQVCDHVSMHSHAVVVRTSLKLMDGCHAAQQPVFCRQSEMLLARPTALDSQ